MVSSNLRHKILLTASHIHTFLPSSVPLFEFENYYDCMPVGLDVEVGDYTTKWDDGR